MVWKKGQSGNPSGRRPMSADERASREKALEAARCATPLAVETLVKIMTSKAKGTTNCDKISAARAILDRGLGKPTQTIDVNQTLSLIDVLRDLNPVIEGETDNPALEGEPGEVCG